MSIFKRFLLLAILPVACMALEPRGVVKLSDPNGDKQAMKVQIRMLKQAIDKAKGAEKREAQDNKATLDSLLQG